MFVFLKASLQEIEKSVLILRIAKTSGYPEIEFLIRFDEKQGVPKVQKIFDNIKRGLKLELIYYLYAFGNTTGLKFIEEYPKEGFQYRRNIKWRDSLNKYKRTRDLLTDLLFDYYGGYTQDEIMEFSQLFCSMLNEPDDLKGQQMEALANKLIH